MEKIFPKVRFMMCFKSQIHFILLCFSLTLPNCPQKRLLFSLTGFENLIVCCNTRFSLTLSFASEQSRSLHLQHKYVSLGCHVTSGDLFASVLKRYPSVG